MGGLGSLMADVGEKLNAANLSFASATSPRARARQISRQGFATHAQVGLFRSRRRSAAGKPRLMRAIPVIEGGDHVFALWIARRAFAIEQRHHQQAPALITAAIARDAQIVCAAQDMRELAQFCTNAWVLAAGRLGARRRARQQERKAAEAEKKERTEHHRIILSNKASYWEVNASPLPSRGKDR